MAQFLYPKDDVVDLTGNVLAVDDVLIGNDTSILDRLNNGINVLDYDGVDPTGQSDSARGMEAAFAAAVAQNRDLIIPNGDYLIDSIETSNPYSAGIYVSVTDQLQVICSNGANLIAGPNLYTEIEADNGFGAVVRISRPSDESGSVQRFSWYGGRFDLSGIPGEVTGIDGLSIGPKFERVDIEKITFDHGVGELSGSSFGTGGGDSSVFCKEPEYFSATDIHCYGAPDIGIYLSGDDDYPTRIGQRCVITGGYFYRCTNAISIKRYFQNTKVIGASIYECGNGIRTANTGTNEVNHGRKLSVIGCTLKKCQGSMITLENADYFEVVGNEILDYRNWISDGTTNTSVSSGNFGAAVGVFGCTGGGVIVGNVLGFEEWTASELANADACGVVLRDYNDTDLAVPCKNVVVTGNLIKGCSRAFRTVSTTENCLIAPNLEIDCINESTLTGVTGIRELYLGKKGNGLSYFSDNSITILSDYGEVVRFNQTAGTDPAALNGFEFTARGPGEAVTMAARGDSTHINLEIKPKGSNGKYYLSTSQIPDHADDAAAAANGVGLAGLYRTGSTLKIRVA